MPAFSLTPNRPARAGSGNGIAARLAGGV